MSRGQYEIVYGDKCAATEGMSRAQLAKLIRADIKAAVKAGELPRAKYSVRTSSYSGGGSIDVRISDVEATFPILSAGRLRWDLENPNLGHWACPSDFRALHSPEADAVLSTVKAIVGAYNYDGSDIQTDYFNVRFYGDVTFCWEWEAKVKERELAAVRAEMAAEKEERGPVLAPSSCVPLAPFPRETKAPTVPAPSAQLSYLESLGVEP